jgi:hypothetical protein
MTDTFRLAALGDADPTHWATLASLLAGTDISASPDWTHTKYSSYSERGDGGRTGRGSPVVAWRWKGLRLSQRETLRAFVTGLSTEVYIQTPTNETTSSGTVRTWANYRAQMLWLPADENVSNINVDVLLDVDIGFRHCVVI